MSRFVVTGAAGFIGSHLTEALRARGDEVLPVDAFTDYYDPAVKEENAAGLDVLRLDLAEETLDVAGIDGVFHLAGQPGVRASWGGDFALYVRRNVLATQRVLEAAVPAGIRVVYASSSSIYGDAEAYPTPEETEPRPISPYGITKLACEHLLYAYRADAVALRYFTVYGPRQRPDMFFTRMLRALADGSGFTLYGDGSASRSFTYVADAVEATLAAMERGDGVYNVGGGSETTVNEAIALAERIAGRRVEVRRREAQPGDVRRTRADTERIRVDLGWEARTPLEEGLQAQWEWASSRVAAR
ncbi:MAG: NAD-dependent epimerase/dehydratase family protein [Actinomycetota bacterium]|nr:NAD-dependent epimerase/dehydratase family protein [Actinomycetota bacterium]